MIEHYFVQPEVLRRLPAGLTAPYLSSLASELQTLHYARKSIRRQLRTEDALGRWLANRRRLTERFSLGHFVFHQSWGAIRASFLTPMLLATSAYGAEEVADVSLTDHPDG